MQVIKGWGYEDIWASTENYCGKKLVFNSGAQCSMHFHAVKDETWVVESGEFRVEWIDTDTGAIKTQTLKVGDTWHNPPLLPHRLVCIKKGTVSEVSTYDDSNDNYRVLPGDSQCMQ